MKNKICSIGIIGIVLFAVWMTGKKQQGMPESAEMNIAMDIELSDIEVQSAEEAEQAEEKYSYYVYFQWVDSENSKPENRYGQRIMWLLPSDSYSLAHREQINRLLIEEGKSRLPDGEETEWWDAASIHVDYQSDRYLFWHYISPVQLPQECKWEDLYFGLDVEEGKLLEHPYDLYLYPWRDDEKPYLKMEECWGKTVEEQAADYEKTEYELLKTQGECDGTGFPAVKVTGMADEAVQKRINECLQEGLRTFIENGEWSDKEYRQELLNKTKIYISYKSDRLLSVVYSIPIPEQNGLDDGILDLPVVLDMQTGELLKLDDLVDVEALKYWLVCQGVVSDGFTWQMHGIISMEEELFLAYYGSGYGEYDKYTALDRFYLDRGRLILLEYQSSSDDKIPLSELFDCLKVDPWYD